MGTNHTSDQKQRDLEPSRVRRDTGFLTTQQGARVDHTDDSLTAGERGLTLLEDFHARQKITNLDHARIPERVVHARGAGAYGFFEPYDDWLAEYTAAKFLTTPGTRNPVSVRFSTVAGSRGSADTVRDVHGFATKFYTEQATTTWWATTFRSCLSKTASSSTSTCSMPRKSFRRNRFRSGRWARWC